MTNQVNLLATPLPSQMSIGPKDIGKRNQIWDVTETFPLNEPPVTIFQEMALEKQTLDAPQCRIIVTGKDSFWFSV